MFDQCGDPLPGKINHGLQFVGAEGMAFGRALDFDEGTGIIHDHVHIGFGAGIFGIVKVQDRYALVDADGDGGDVTVYRVLLQHVASLHVTYGVDQGHVTAGDRRRTGAAIRLQDITVDDDRFFTERFDIDGRTQGATDQPLNFQGPSALSTARGFARHALSGGSRQHAVFRRYPALSAALQKARHLVVDTGVAQHACIAEFDQDGPFRMLGKVSCQPDWSECVG